MQNETSGTLTPGKSLERFVHVTRVGIDPVSESLLHLLDILQLPCADLVQLLWFDLMVKMDHPVAVACKDFEEDSIVSMQNSLPLQLEGNFLVFRDPDPEPFGQDMPAEIKQSFQ